MDDTAIMSLILQRLLPGDWRFLFLVATSFLAQNALEDVFALTRWQIVEKILRRHLDEPKQTRMLSVKNHTKFYWEKA